MMASRPKFTIREDGRFILVSLAIQHRNYTPNQREHYLECLRLAFEGAGGACWQFDGVFGASFFGVLFQG
jgi:hypothetical protein